MKKLKVYFDTSVISHLDAPDRLDWERDTRQLWRAIQTGEYEVYLSPVVMGELDECAEPKHSFLLNQLQSIRFTELQKHCRQLKPGLRAFA